MTTTTTSVPTADGPMDLYEATPASKPRGAVIVIQEAFGVNEHIQDVTRRFAAAGYRAVAPALFHRAGGGTAPYTDFSKVMPLFKGVNDDAVVGFYGGGIVAARRPGFPTLIGDTAKLGSPWLGLFGDKDQGIPVEDVEQLRAALDRETRQPHEVVLYEGAEHGFHCDVRPSYNEPAAKDA